MSDNLRLLSDSLTGRLETQLTNGVMGFIFVKIIFPVIERSNPLGNLNFPSWWLAGHKGGWGGVG